MDNKMFFIANWKSNKTTTEAISWLEKFKTNINKISFDNKEVIICPSYTSLSSCHEYILKNKLPLKLGAQNISRYGSGAYTGEVSARQLKEFCEYVIIGHSERKKYLKESSQDLRGKIDLAKSEKIKTVVCIQDEDTDVLDETDIDIIAYEPFFAIGTGNPDSPDNISKVFYKIENNTRKKILLYGGSIDEKNINNYLNIPLLSGFLVGTASLDPEIFNRLLSKC